MKIARLPVVVTALLLGACAALGIPRTVEVEVLETGYLVSNNVLASSAELTDFLVGQDVRRVRLIPLKGAPAARLAEANAAIRDAGASVIDSGGTVAK